MSIALTNYKIVKATFHASTRTEFIEKVNGYLVQVGWIPQVVAGGYKYSVTSPQGLQAYAFWRDKGHTAIAGDPQVTFNWTTVLEDITGMDQEIVIRPIPDRDFVIIAGKCYFRIATLGVNTDQGGSSLIAEIPFTNKKIECETLITTKPAVQCWISMGDHSNGGSPRQALILGSSFFGPNTQASCEALWDTDLCEGGNPYGSLRIPMLTTATFIFQAFNFPSPDIWGLSNNFWRVEPNLVWGKLNSDLPLLRAQCWDCMLFARPFAGDTIVNVDDLDWYIYTDNYFYGVMACLFSNTGEGGQSHNPANGQKNLGVFTYD